MSLTTQQVQDTLQKLAEIRKKMIRLEEVLTKLKDSILTNEDGSVAIDLTTEQKDSLTDIYDQVVAEIKTITNLLP